MTARLREMLIEMQKEEVLKEYLGDSYEKASRQEKDSFLSYVIENIENSVDKMLNDHVEQHIKNAPEKKDHNRLMLFYTSFSVALTALLGYAFNEENLILIIISYALLVGTQSLPYIVNQKR